MVKAEINENGCIKKQCTKTLDEVYKEFLEVGCGKYQENTIYNTKRDYEKITSLLRKSPIVKLDYATLQKFFNSRSNQGIRNKQEYKKGIEQSVCSCLENGVYKYQSFNICRYKRGKNKWSIRIVES